MSQRKQLPEHEERTPGLLQQFIDTRQPLHVI
jgi:hypothetical protein